MNELERLMEQAPQGSVLMSSAKTLFYKVHDAWAPVPEYFAKQYVLSWHAGQRNWDAMLETDRAAVCTPEGVLHLA